MATEGRADPRRRPLSHPSTRLTVSRHRTNRPIALRDQFHFRTGDKCDGGLHLHFWRKKCMNCQCGPEA